MSPTEITYIVFNPQNRHVTSIGRKGEDGCSSLALTFHPFSHAVPSPSNISSTGSRFFWLSDQAGAGAMFIRFYAGPIPAVGLEQHSGGHGLAVPASAQ